jgi:hypothetical protein
VKNAFKKLLLEEDRTAFRMMVGSFPVGSEWTKNPIRACAGGWGGGLDKDKDCKEETQVDPPAPGLKGFGTHIHNPGVIDFHFSIIDHVQVPADLMPGDYVLSCWSACSSIKIKNN